MIKRIGFIFQTLHHKSQVTSCALIILIEAFDVSVSTYLKDIVYFSTKKGAWVVNASDPANMVVIQKLQQTTPIKNTYEANGFLWVFATSKFVYKYTINAASLNLLSTVSINSIIVMDFVMN